MNILCKAIYRFNSMSNETIMAFFTELQEIIQNLYGNTKDPEEQKHTEKEKQSRMYHAP